MFFLCVRMHLRNGTFNLSLDESKSLSQVARLDDAKVFIYMNLLESGKPQEFS